MENEAEQVGVTDEAGARRSGRDPNVTGSAQHII